MENGGGGGLIVPMTHETDTFGPFHEKQAKK